MKKTLTLVLTLVMIVSLAFGMFACKAQVRRKKRRIGSTGCTTSATVCVGPEPATLDPNMNEAVDGMIYITHLYEGLYRPNTDGTFSLGQAKEVTITDNADGTAHVVAKLRDDIKWSDGKPVTGERFRILFGVRLCDPATGSSYGYIGQDFFANGAQQVRDGPSRRISSASKQSTTRRWSSISPRMFPTPRTFWRSRA